MADDKEKQAGGSSAFLSKEEGEKLGQLIGTIIGIFLVMAALQNISTRLKESFHTDFSHPASLYQERPVGVETVVGAHVRSHESVTVWSEPGGGSLLGRQPSGMKGVISDGPARVLNDNEWWWEVDFATLPDGWVPESSLTQLPLLPWLDNIVFGYIIIVGSISIALVWGIVYASRETGKIRAAEKEKMAPLPVTDLADQLAAGSVRWEAIQNHLLSDNESDWKLAIIEADILLNEILSKMGYAQATVGEKLMSIERADLSTLEEAWQAHKVRNQIAHQGSGFVISLDEARRTIGRYEKVFRELEYI
jgi:hypothetical protein